MEVVTLNSPAANIELTKAELSKAIALLELLRLFWAEENEKPAIEQVLSNLKNIRNNTHLQNRRGSLQRHRGHH